MTPTKTKVSPIKDVKMKPVKLGVFTMDEKHVRFCMIDRNDRICNSNSIHMAGCHPVFLGTDILHGTPEWDKNMHRIHARFAKQGLATKLVFKDCRIDGLRKGNKAYFYSVFGLFRVVFEYHSCSVQRQCLQLLTDVWMKTSRESLPQLKEKYEVSLNTFLLAPDLPPPAAAAAATWEDDSQTQEKPPSPSTPPAHSLIPHVAKLPMPNTPGQQISSDRASARLGKSESLQESSGRGTAAVQHSSTQTDLSLSAASASPEVVVLLETVCKRCGVRRKRMEREKAEGDSLVRVSKKPRLQVAETGGESIHQGGMFVECPEENPAGRTSGTTEVKAGGVQLSDGCFSRHPQSPSSETRFSHGSPSRLAGEPDSKVRTGFPSSSSQHETQEPHVHTKVTSGTNDADSDFNQSTDSPRAHTPPQQRFQRTALCSRVSEREEVPVAGVERDLDTAQAQKVLCHAQTQTCQVVFDSVTHSFVEVDSLSGLNGFKSSVAVDSVRPVTTHPEGFCLEPSIGLENNVPVLTDTVENNVHMLTDTAENNVHVLMDTVENNVQMLTDTAENNVPVLMDTGESHVQMLTDTAPHRYTECPVEKIQNPVSQTGSAGMAECVQSWIKQVHELKLRLRTEDTTIRAKDSFEDAVPDSARRAPQRPVLQLEILQLVLEFFLPIMDAVSVTTPSDVSTVSEILTLILNAAENSTESASASSEWSMASPLKLSVLTMVGSWLGAEFCHFKPAVFQKVTAFKHKHIDNIGGLPSAVQIIAELFPSCMVQFIGAWIGLADAQNVEAMEKDHCYQYQSGSGTGMAQQQNRSQLPLVQLVLELLNNALVSGIAHVVFCKL